MAMKLCRKCQTEKPLTEFYADHRTKDGRCHTCKPCHEARYRSWKRANAQKVSGYNRKWYESSGARYRRYGITKQGFLALLDKQGGLCAICGNPETSTINGKLRPLQIDHSHNSGKVRGLLCSACNTGLGKFRDDPDLLRAAARYATRK